KATAINTATIPGQLPRPAQRHDGIVAIDRRANPSLGNMNWSTHITTVTHGTAMEDQLATTKTPFSTTENRQVTAAAIAAINKHVCHRRQPRSPPSTFCPA